MTAITFDTFQIHKSLKSRGFTEEQAEALTDMARETMKASLDAQDPQDLTGFVTKGDLLSVEMKIETSKAEVLKWMFGGFLAIIGLLVGILLKLT